MPQFALGIDFGTNSVRALVVDCADGRELGTGVVTYASGDEGVISDPHDNNLARQNPADYEPAMREAIAEAMSAANVNELAGIGVDTTGSTPIPVDQNGTPLGMHQEFKGHLAAYAWLWKDHSAFAEAERITAHAREKEMPYLAKCGGVYSSEWFWSKALHCARTAPDVFNAAHTWMECCDVVTGFLTGLGTNVRRSTCAAGHKGMYSDAWGGYPDRKFLEEISNGLATLLDRLPAKTYTSDHRAGTVPVEIARSLSLPAGTPVAVGTLDAHAGAVASGVAPGRMVKIIGTSTCDILVGTNVPDIPGVAGIVEGSVIPGLTGIEAGQSAVGDIFAWWSRVCGRSQGELSKDAEKLRAGESGLLALDWNNGNRNVLADPLLTGLLVGQTLHTTPAEIYRALIEATAFGASKIIKRIEEHGIEIREIVACGGIAEKSSLTMQIYADVLNRPIRLSRSSQAPALGAAIYGAVVGGVHKDVQSAQAAMTGFRDLEYRPEAHSAGTYQKLFEIYEHQHDAYGVPDLMPVMKRLLRVRTLSR